MIHEDKSSIMRKIPFFMHETNCAYGFYVKKCTFLCICIYNLHFQLAKYLVS